LHFERRSRLAIRKRTSKSVAKRHDLDYFKKGSPIRLWQWRLALVALVCAVVWIALATSRNATAFSAGPVSASHAVFAEKCDTCHKPVIPGAGWLPVIGARHNVPDSACLSCHQVGTHHADIATGSKPCSSCHIEHIGAMHLASAPVKGCTQCHANLETRGAVLAVATHIESFTHGHPEFQALRAASGEIREAAYGLKFNHEAHLQKDLTGPNGTTVNLDCASCHRVSDMGERGTAQSGRMAPVDFDRSCRSCHSLEFDRRVTGQAPHTDAATVLRFVQEKMATTAPHDEAALVSAETIVFREKCALCHTVSGAENLPRAIGAALDVPTIAPAKQPERFYTSAVFSHSAHGAVQCAECHAAALTSTSGKDLLLPGIATCQRCHDGQSNPQGPLPAGHAESGCSLCHTYHEGGRQHPATASPAFRIDQLVPSR
jgi:hypothetical protein